MATVDVEALVFVRGAAPELRREIRQRHGLSQQELAEAIDSARLTVWRYEQGLQRPSGDVGHRYCQFLYQLASRP